MPAASFTLFHSFTERVMEGGHNMQSDDIQIYLSNATPTQSGDNVKADLAEISTGNGYTGPVSLANKTSAQSGGIYTFDSDEVTITADGGDIGPFRYAVMMNTTPTSPADPLIAYLDYGEAISIEDGNSLIIRPHATNGWFRFGPGTLS